MKNKIFTVFTCLFIILLTVSFSIALPIYIRPFYYAHIKAYDLEDLTGKSEQQIKSAYDDVLDYLTLPNKEFKTGDFAYSEEGKSHFKDCKLLFNINFITLVVSALGIVVLVFLKKKSVFTPLKPFGKNVTMTAGGLTLALFVALAGICAIDFDTAFTVFHKIFFYGKQNWIFDSRTDEIITALPQEFFLNCAILIVASIVLISVALILIGAFAKQKKK